MSTFNLVKMAAAILATLFMLTATSCKSSPDGATTTEEDAPPTNEEPAPIPEDPPLEEPAPTNPEVPVPTPEQPTPEEPAPTSGVGVWDNVIAGAKIRCVKTSLSGAAAEINEDIASQDFDFGNCLLSSAKLTELQSMYSLFASSWKCCSQAYDNDYDIGGGKAVFNMHVSTVGSPVPNGVNLCTASNISGYDFHIQNFNQDLNSQCSDSDYQ